MSVATCCRTLIMSSSHFMPNTQPALLIIDVQKGFINDATKHIPARVEGLQKKYKTVFATQFYNPDPSNFRKLIGWNRFTAGSPDTELAFTPIAHVAVITKPTYSCVTASFLEELKRRNIDTIHICGIDTDICVTKCAVDLFEKNLIPFVLKDCVASHAGIEAHRAALITIGRFIGRNQII